MIAIQDHAILDIGRVYTFDIRVRRRHSNVPTTAARRFNRNRRQTTCWLGITDPCRGGSVVVITTGDGSKGHSRCHDVLGGNIIGRAIPGIREPHRVGQNIACAHTGSLIRIFGRRNDGLNNGETVRGRSQVDRTTTHIQIARRHTVGFAATLGINGMFRHVCVKPDGGIIHALDCVSKRKGDRHSCTAIIGCADTHCRRPRESRHHHSTVINQTGWQGIGHHQASQGSQHIGTTHSDRVLDAIPNGRGADPTITLAQRRQVCRKRYAGCILGTIKIVSNPIVIISFIGLNPI